MGVSFPQTKSLMGVSFPQTNDVKTFQIINNPEHLLTIPGTGLAFFRDISKRKSRCRICTEDIPKGTLRIRSENRGVFSGRTGQFFCYKRYYHPECIVDAFKGTYSPSTARCPSCGLMVKRSEASPVLPFVGTRAIYCKKCIEEKEIYNTYYGRRLQKLALDELRELVALDDPI